MKTLILFLSLTGYAAAQVPVKKPAEEYQRLWSNSPFTSLPAPQPAPAAGTIAGDYSLIGVSELADGVQVTLENRKDSAKTVVIRPNQDAAFSVVQVSNGTGKWQDIRVTLTDGQRTETLQFDEKTLSTPPRLVAPKPKAPAVPPRAVIVPEN